MQISNKQGFNKLVKNNQDEYGQAIIRYAIRWADLMEEAMQKNQQLEECARELSHTADTEGITGFMYGAAVSVLRHCWIHGDALNSWHNRSYGIDSSEGTVNPAILHIKTDKDN